ncbi:unnamed protein product [Onchocerca flexuosa]|uniref:A20-type domain-containing protein n=1 Tax=Onchocerca flexuosa TaxID=387005 RepID=A0A183HEU1_9BILA|nr:unnamed protein product [Onchocerca flexuosa]
MHIFRPKKPVLVGVAEDGGIDTTDSGSMIHDEEKKETEKMSVSQVLSVAPVASAELGEAQPTIVSHDEINTGDTSTEPEGYEAFILSLIQSILFQLSKTDQILKRIFIHYPYFTLIMYRLRWQLQLGERISFACSAGARKNDFCSRCWRDIRVPLQYEAAHRLAAMEQDDSNVRMSANA